MWVEAPIQVDLSQDDSWDNIDDIHLTDSEKTLLAQQFSEESEGIVYFTREELQNFKAILASEDPGMYTSQLQEFAAEQLSEGLSSEDILSGVDWLPEGIWESLDKHAEEILFGLEGVLNGLNLSDTARDNIITSLSMSALWNLSLSSNFEWDISELFLGMVKNLSLLQNLVHQRVQLPIGWEIPALVLSEDGDKNYIFSDANVWKDFFDFLSGDSVSEEKIKTYIEERNLPTGSETIITNNINGLSVWAQEDLQSILSALWTKDNTDTDWETSQATTIDSETLPSKDDLDEMEEKWGLFAMFAKMIREFMQWIIKFWEESWLIDGSDDQIQNPEGNPDEAEEIAPTTLENGRSLFRTNISEENISPFTQTQIQELFPEEWELTQTAKDIITTIDTIPGKKSFESEFYNLFAVREGKETTKFEEFITASGDLFITEWEPVTPENLLAILTEYNRYRVWGTEASYTVYFASRLSDDSDQN